MKTIKPILCSLIFLLFLPSINAQISTNKDIAILLKKSEKDSIAKIERLAALGFHKLINEYRQSKNLSVISWDETLWIATKNHNAWMAEADILSHNQYKKNKYYTGSGPGDRFNYAAGGNSPNGWSGENALYNYSAYGKSIKEIAQNIAFRSFKQWKNSPGHNRNMLRKGHVSHGTAFKITNDKVWGTDLFSSNNAPYDFNNSTPLYTKTKKKRSKRFSTFKTKRILTTQVLKELSIKIKKSKNSEAKEKVERLLSKRFKNKNGVLYSKKTAAKSRGIFKFFSKNKNTYALVIEKMWMILILLQ
ncbi:MAG: CAP domain-containing protein [Flavobacteriales bacterium]|nr:CAP domain-containing protein [Flavobacteriales bacterium]